MAKLSLLQSPGSVQSTSSLVRLVPQLAAPDMTPIAKGLDDLGQGMLKLKEHAQAANDSAGLTDLQIALNDKTLEFQKWKDENTDENLWEPKAQEMIKGVEDSFKNYRFSGQGRDRFDLQMSDFKTRALMRVQLDSVRQTGERAITSAQTLSKQRQDAGDIEGSGAPFLALPNTIIHPEMAAAAAQKAEEGAKATVQQRTATQLDNFAEGGDTVGIERMVSDPKTVAAFANNPEKLESLKLEALGKAKQTGLSRIIREGIAEDPKGSVLRLEAKDAEGNYVHYPEIPKAQRISHIEEGRALMDYNDANTLKDLVNSHLNGLSKAELMDPKKPFLGKYSGMSASHRAKFDEFLAKPPANDPMDFQRFQTKIDAADLTNDFAKVKLQQEALMTFSGPMLNSVNSRIDEKLKGDKTPRAEAELFQEVDADGASGQMGEFRVPGDKITIDEKTGQAERIIEPKSFGMFAGKTAPIKLSEEDRLRWLKADTKERAGMILEDLDAKRAASTEVARLKAEMEKVEGDVQAKRVKYYELTNNPRLEKARKLLEEQQGPSTPLIPSDQPKTLLAPTAEETAKILKLHGK